MTTTTARELRHVICGISAGDGHSPDNLICALASYFEGCRDCPEETPDENGWQPWAIKQAEGTITAIVDRLLAYGAERFAEGQAEMRERCLGVLALAVRKSIESKNPTSVAHIAVRTTLHVCSEKIAALPASPAPGSVLVPRDGWISCSERLPVRGEEVIAVMTYAVDEHGFEIALYDKNGWNVHSSDAPFVTHWQPLPNPPSATGKDS